ncbi:hypothetical protein ACHWQZ_G016250 [Mnemiopsis leidyi]
MLQTLTEIGLRTLSLQRFVFFFIIAGELEIRTVASCTFYNVDTFSFEHWECPDHQICCIYYGAKSCCREEDAYMNNGYSHGGDHGNHHHSHEGFGWQGELMYFLKTQQVEEEAEEAELMRINQMIAISEGRGSMYHPQPPCSQHHGQPSESTAIASQQPPSYDSVSKNNNRTENSSSQEASPPPPYKP